MRLRPAQLSLVLHAAALLALLHIGAVQRHQPPPPRLDLISTKLVFHPEIKVAAGGGGGRDAQPPKLGKPPETSTRPFVPPTTRPPDHEPVLPMAPSVLGPTSTQHVPVSILGDPTGLPGPPSDGPGRGPGIGRGPGRYGVGDGAEDGGVYRGGPGAVTTQVQLVYKVEPEYSDQARIARLQGLVTLRVEIDETGRPVAVEVRQSLGLGLDEKAIEAVRRWRFKPATRDGKPVRAPVLVDVSFRLL